jgi:methionyl-tRNA formyltransferase
MGAIFLGTPAAGVPSLCALAQVDNIELVVTQPDRAVGRSSMKVPSPVKVAARQFGFRVEQPETADQLFEMVQTVNANVALVVAYGRILSPELLATVPLGFLNVHFSLLPRWRGAAPVERAIAAGDDQTGVTLMQLDAGLDTGPVIAERVTDIADDDTGGSLTARLAHIGARLVDDSLPQYLLGRRVPVPQISTGATHAARLTKEEAEIRVGLPAIDALRRIRAFAPRPGAWITTSEGVLRIHQVGPSITSDYETQSINQSDGRIILGLRDGGLHLQVIQPEGKPRMSAEAWMNGRRGESLLLLSDDT